MQHEAVGNTNCNWFSRNGPIRIGKGTGRHRNKRTSGHNPNYSIIKIGQNIEKRSRDLRRLAITQTPVKQPPSNAGVKKNLQGVK